MGIKRAFDRFEAWLNGWPNGALSVFLIVAAVVLVIIALRGKPYEKAVALAYVVFP